MESIGTHHGAYWEYRLLIYKQQYEEGSYVSTAYQGHMNQYKQ